MGKKKKGGRERVLLNANFQLLRSFLSVTVRGGGRKKKKKGRPKGA